MVISERLLSCDLQFEIHYVRSSLPKSSSQTWILFLLLFLCILNVVIFYTRASWYIHIHLLFKKKTSAAYFIPCSVSWDFSPRRVSCDSSYSSTYTWASQVWTAVSTPWSLTILSLLPNAVSKGPVLLSEQNPNSDHGLKALHNLVLASSLNSPKPFSLLSGHSLPTPEHAKALLHLCVLSAWDALPPLISLRSQLRCLWCREVFPLQNDPSSSLHRSFVYPVYFLHGPDQPVSVLFIICLLMYHLLPF